MSFALPFCTNQVVRAAEIVTEDEADELFAWAEEMRRSGNLVANPRDRTTLQTPYVSARTRQLTALSADRQERDDVIWVPQNDRFDPAEIPEAFWTVRDRSIKAVGAERLTEDPYKGNFLGLIGPGEGVHQHKDARIVIGGEQSLLIRCNVLFRRPDEGGLPVIAGQVLDVADRGMWAFFASEQVHAATPVAGAKLRGLLSFGLVIERERVGAACYQLKPEFRAYVDQQPSGWSEQFVQELAQAGTPLSIVTFARHALDCPDAFALGSVASATGLTVWDALTAVQKLELSGLTEPVGRPTLQHKVVTL
jgi:hypothetical protein